MTASVSASPRTGRDYWTRGPRGHAYSGAARTGNFGLWRPQLRSVDAEIAEDGPELRARARDLERNHPFARQAVRTSRIGVIGKRLRYSCRPDWRFLGIDEDEAFRWAQEWERVWETYAHGTGFHLDAGRRLNFTQLMGVIHDADFIDGEYLAVGEWAPDRRYATCFQLVDVDRLSQPQGRPARRDFRGGIEFDALSAPIAYHIRAGHPSDYGFGGETDRMHWRRIERETPWGRPIVFHGFDTHRAGQTRGRSEMASVITAMKMGSEFTETALQSAVLQASYAAVLQSKSNYRDAMEAIGFSGDADALGRDTIMQLAAENLEAAQAWHEELGFRFQGAKVPKLFPDEELKLLSTGNNAAPLGEFQSHAARSYAAGVGVDPIGVSQDYSNVNYSSAKMSQATTFRGYDTRRERLTQMVALPMVGALLEEMVHAGDFPLPRGVDPADFYAAKDALVNGVFLSQGAPNLDPVKEAQALEVRLRLGMDTLQDAAAAEGRDWRDIVSQRAREMRVHQEAGIAVDALGLPLEAAPAEDDAPAEEPADDAVETEA